MLSSYAGDLLEEQEHLTTQARFLKNGYLCAVTLQKRGMKKSQSQLRVNSNLCRSLRPHCKRSAAALCGDSLDRPGGPGGELRNEVPRAVCHHHHLGRGSREKGKCCSDRIK